jgi:hypothetical protein
VRKQSDDIPADPWLGVLGLLLVAALSAAALWVIAAGGR